jgi:hypothetical protein
MKAFNEWKSEQHDSPDKLLDIVESLAEQLSSEIKSFTGERFEGFLEMIGSVNELQKLLAHIKNGSSPQQWVSKGEI